MPANLIPAAEQPSSDLGQPSPAAALLASEENFRHLFEVASVGMAQTDPRTWQWLQVNPKFCEITGYTAQELLQLRVPEITHPDDRAADQEAFQRVIRGEQPNYQMEKRYVRKDASVVWVNVNVSVIRDAAGQPVCTVATIEDITGRKQVEQALEQERNVLRTLIDHIPDLIYVRDAANRFVVANQAVARYMGAAAPAELIGKTDADFFHSVAAANFANIDQGVFAGHAILNKERVIQFPNREERVLLTTKIPLQNEQGEVIGMVGVGRDITERKLVEHYSEISRAVLQVFNETNELKPALQKVIAILHAQTGFEAVGIRLRAGEDYPYFAQQGFPESFLKTENSLVACTANGDFIRDTQGRVCLECTCGLVLSNQTDPAHPHFTSGGSCWTNDTLPLSDAPPGQDPRLHPRNQCIHHGYASIALVPLRTHEQILGLLQFNDRRQGCFTLETIKLLETLATHMGSAVLRLQAEAGLRASETRHAKMVANIGDVIVIIDQAGINRYKSPNFEKWFGWKPAEVVGTPALDNVHPQDWESAQMFLCTLMCEPNATGTMECRYRCQDGTYKWIEFSGVNLLHDPDICGLLGNYQDITARKTAEAALHKSRHLLAQTEKIGQVGGWEFEMDTLKMVWTEAVFQIHELESTEQPSVEQALKFYTPESRPIVEAAVRRAVELGEPFDLELEIITARGHRRQVHTIGKVDQEQRKVVGFFQDITARKTAEAALRASEEGYRLLFDTMLDGFALHEIICDDAGQPVDYRYISVNPAFERLTGLQAADVIDRTVLEIMPDTEPAWIERYGRVALTGEAVQFEDYSEALQRYFEVAAFSPGRGRFAVVFVDITERKQAEAKLARSEERYRDLMTNLEAGVVVHAPDTAIVSHNSRAAELLGLTDEQMRGKQSFDPKWKFINNDGKPYLIEEYPVNQIVRKRQAIRDLVFGIERPATNDVVWVSVSGVPVLDRKGEISEVVISFIDITERQQAEAALRASRNQLQSIFRAAPVGIGVVRSRVFVEINERVCEITGYRREELLGASARLLYPSEAEFAWVGEEKYRQITRQGTGTVETRWQKKDGTIIDVLLSSTPLDAADLSQGVTFSALDMTERKRSQESHARLATAVEQAAESIVVTDVRGTILYANPAFEKNSGYTCAEALGQNPRLLKSGKHESGFYQHMWDTLTRGEIWAGRMVNRRKDGTTFDEEVTISPVRDVDGKVVNYVAVKRNVTREMQLENQLRQSQKMEAIGTLSGGVAHDFNNILSSIIMQTELISMTATLNGEDREGLDQIRADADRAAHLTRQLLLFSRRQVMQSRLLDLNESVMAMAKMLQRIIGEDVHLHLHLHVTPLRMQADPGMMDQVLMNLAVNARDAMPDGGELNLETSEKIVDESFAKSNPEAQPGRYACLSVRDTGGGIPPEILPRIFEPFFTTKEVGKGTGLGLSTVFGIVKQHRGWLQVDNQPGQGVAFQIYLPLDPAAAASDDTAARPKPRGGSETILLVEDEAAVRQSLRMVLQRHGYTVIEADTGREALKLWPEHQAQIALLLTDLVMPGGVSGQELGRQLAAAQPKLKIIYISGYSPEIAGRELHLSSGENYLQKPLATEQLLETIRHSLDH